MVPIKLAFFLYPPTLSYHLTPHLVWLSPLTKFSLWPSWNVMGGSTVAAWSSVEKHWSRSQASEKHHSKSARGEKIQSREITSSTSQKKKEIIGGRGHQDFFLVANVIDSSVKREAQLEVGSNLQGPTCNVVSLVQCPRPHIIPQACQEWSWAQCQE